ncbi:MAG: LysR family transcriptional regulator [Alphaproteobacteria bacterium]|nr:LysR family transcriptional regulator [Alphaproteobacteria bacterium]
MNLRQMEIFHAVMTHGTVTGAARALNISQPSVTGVLRHTEDLLRFKLFERVRGRLIPTAEAQAIFAQIEHVFERVDGVRRTIDNLRDVRSGSINIVAIPAVGATLLPAAIGEFVKAHPEVTIRFQMRTRREVAELVESRAVDVGFGFLTSDLPRIVHHEIIRRDMICIMPRGHPLERLARVSVADIADFPLISYTSTQGLAPIINSIFAEARLNFRPSVEVGLIINAWAMVNVGAGLALVDPFSAIGAMYPNVVARPFVPSSPIAFEMIRAHERPLSRAAGSFVRHIDAFVRAKDLFASGRGADAGVRRAPRR